MWSITQHLRPPTICRLCEQYQRAPLAICKQCLELLQPIPNPCPHCGMPLPDKNLICGKCMTRKPIFDFMVAPYAFVEPLRTLIHEFKYEEGLYLTSFFAELILNNLTLDMLKTECLIPIPLHNKRLRERGYNQAAELTKILAKKLQKSYHLFACRKIINTTPQANLNFKQRNKNLRNAFRVVKKHAFQHITIVDDLITTGSTANELAKTLKANGIARVDLWCCART